METARTADRAGLARQCVKCGLCLPHCPTYRLARTESESPRGRIALMAAMTEDAGLSGPHPALDACLGCRLCETACPAGVEYENLLLQTRRAAPPRLSWRATAALWLMAHKSWLNAGLQIYQRLFPLLPRAWRPLPRPTEARPAAAKARNAGTAVFSGCVADTFEAGARESVLRLLRAAGEQGVVPETQNCCGQAARHAGRGAEADRLAAANRAAFAGYERMLVLATGCHGALADSLSVPAVDAAVYLAECADALRFRSAQGRRVALHTPCSAAFHGSQQAVRALLARIPDLELVPVPDSGCCGAAGLHQLTDPVRAAALRRPIADAVTASGVDTLLSSNIGCRLHLADGTGAAVRHPLEFMAEYLDDA